MIDIGIGFFICIFEIYVYYDFLQDILEKRLENKCVIGATLGFMAVALYVINQFDISQINLIGVPLLFFFGIVILFCGNWKTKISYCLMLYIIMLSMEFVAGILFMAIRNDDFLTVEKNPFGNFFLIIITKLLSYVALRLIRLFINRKEIGMRGKLLKMAFLLPITTILLYTGLFYANIQIGRGKIILSIGCILLLFSNVLVFYIIEKLTCVMEQNSEYEMMELQNSLTHVYYSKLEEVGIRHKKYAHDLKEYLQTIGGLAAKCKSHEIVEILKDMEVEIDSIPDKLYTSNNILNALLCEKELQAERKGVAFYILIEPELHLDKIKSGDLIVMVGNLLDNAIEGAAMCKDKKKIDLQLFESDGNFVVLYMENTYGNVIRRKGETFLSTKKDAKNHGIGIKSVREIAEKYGGLLFLEQKEDVFVTILTLSKAYQE